MPFAEKTAGPRQSGGIGMDILQGLHDFLWGPFGAALLLTAGIFLTLRAELPQLSLFGKAVRILRAGPRGEGVTPFQALCTALAATVGTGNIVGVTGAICLGGPGAVFWMWVCGFLGMATKFSEVSLAGRYRVKVGKEFVGGPMYMITRGLPKRLHFLAAVYCVFGIAAAFGVGNATQVSAVTAGFHQILRSLGGRETLLGDLVLGLVMALCIGAVLLGGVRRIGKTTEKLVPFAAVGYILLCLLVISGNLRALPRALSSIVKGAFSPRAVTGGAVGSLFSCLSVGLSRGIFTNEAGMGTASMAYCASTGEAGVEMGILGLLEVFVDTIVICTLTALAVLCSGVAIPYGLDAGPRLAVEVFGHAGGDWASVMLTGFLCIFALATVLGWGLYGTRCGRFLFGSRFERVFVYAQMAGVVLGTVMQSRTVWLLAETVNALMAFPNLIALVLLSGELKQMVTAYKRKGRKGD